MEWRTFGHEQVKVILEKQLASQHFAHTYLLAGPDGIGKKMLAMEFAEKILSASRASGHPDFSLLDAEAGIGIEEVRDFIGSLSFKPFGGLYKVAVINGIHLLNTESSNALLKTLEEPSPSTIIILISAHKNILPTVLSRCQVFNLNSFTVPQLTALAERLEHAADEHLLLAAEGSPARLIRSFSDESFLARHKAVLENFKSLKGRAPAERLVEIKSYAEKEPEELREILQSWVAEARYGLNKDIKNYKSIEVLLKALADLRTNKNKQIILQHLFLHF